MLDSAAINSSLLMELKNNNNITDARFRRFQLESLAINLIRPQVLIRMNECCLNKWSGEGHTSLIMAYRID